MTKKTKPKAPPKIPRTKPPPPELVLPSGPWTFMKTLPYADFDKTKTIVIRAPVPFCCTRCKQPLVLQQTVRPTTKDVWFICLGLCLDVISSKVSTQEAFGLPDKTEINNVFSMPIADFKKALDRARGFQLDQEEVPNATANVGPRTQVQEDPPAPPVLEDLGLREPGSPPVRDV